MDSTSDIQLGSEAGPSFSADYAVMSTLQQSLGHTGDRSVSRASIAPATARPLTSFRNQCPEVFSPATQRSDLSRSLPRVYTEAEIADQVSRARQMASQYHPSDIYICDETKLYWKHMPNVPLVQTATARLLNMLCCNADGSDKLPLWLIGTDHTPRAFDQAGVNMNALNVVWNADSNTSLQHKTMHDWLRWFDKRMQGRRVLLFLDDLSVHHAVIDNFRSTQQPLQNTVVYRLPPTSVLHFEPPFKGIIKTFKAHYRKRWLRSVFDQYTAGKDPLKAADLLQAVRWAIQSWQSTSGSAIKSCWVHSTLIPHPTESVTTRGTDASDTSEDPRLISSELIIPETLESKNEIEILIDRLKQQFNVQAYTATTVDDFIDPRVEDYLDQPSNFASNTSGRPTLHEDHEIGEGLEAMPRVSVNEALKALDTLRRFEEQAHDEQPDLIQRLNEHEERLRKKEKEIARQESMTALFTQRS